VLHENIINAAAVVVTVVFVVVAIVADENSQGARIY
jgi:hypothetical protein